MSSTAHSLKYEKKALPASVATLGWGLLGIGVAMVAAAFMVDPQRSKFDSIIMFMFMVSIGIMPMFMIAIEYLAGAVWSTPLRRIFEIFASAILFLPLFALPVLLNLHDLYHWTHLEVVANDPVLTSKAPYLNTTFFFIRFAVIMGLWILFYVLFTRNSAKQDTTNDQSYSHKNAKMAPLFVPIFGLSLTALSIDFLMSLEPHWFSTIFGVNYFAGSLVASLAVMTIAIVLLNENGYLHPGTVADHYYSLGFGMVAGNIFWMYTAFSQGMLIWYANLPEETTWYLNRWDNGWCYITLGQVFVHFVVPFLLLVQRKSKLNPKRMLFASGWIIFAHLFDLYWIVMPVYDQAVHHGTMGPTLSWTEFGFVSLMAGFLIVLFTMKAKNRNLVAIGDPKLQRGLDFRL